MWFSMVISSYQTINLYVYRRAKTYTYMIQSLSVKRKKWLYFFETAARFNE